MSVLMWHRHEENQSCNNTSYYQLYWSSLQLNILIIQLFTSFFFPLFAERNTLSYFNLYLILDLYNQGKKTRLKISFWLTNIRYTFSLLFCISFCYLPCFPILKIKYYPSKFQKKNLTAPNIMTLPEWDCCNPGFWFYLKGDFDILIFSYNIVGK